MPSRLGQVSGLLLLVVSIVSAIMLAINWNTDMTSRQYIFLGNRPRLDDTQYNATMNTYVKYALGGGIGLVGILGGVLIWRSSLGPTLSSKFITPDDPSYNPDWGAVSRLDRKGKNLVGGVGKIR